MAFENVEPVSIKSLLPNLNDKLAQAIHICLSPDPNDRFNYQQSIKLPNRMIG